MTYKEKLAKIRPDRIDPRFRGGCAGCPTDYPELDAEEWPEEDCLLRRRCEQCWNRECLDTEPVLNQESVETVNHPKHYSREGAMECIDEMVLVFGAEATMHFCLLNAWKYRYRAAEKNGEEDLRKSDWYMAKYAELKGGH